MSKGKSSFISTAASFFIGIGTGMMLMRWMSPFLQKQPVKNVERAKKESFQTASATVLDADNSTVQKLERENEEIRQEYQRLLNRMKASEQDVQDRERVALFHAFETAFVQLPVLSERIKDGTDIPMDTVLSLVDMIPEKLETLEIKMLNTPGQVTVFDPILHKPIPSQSGKISSGEPVKVIVPGFQYKDLVLKHSEVRMHTDGK